MKAPSWPLLARWVVVVGALNSPSSGKIHQAPGMVIIPSATIVLGSTMEELVDAGAHCAQNHERGADVSPCSPDNFANELSGKQPARVPRFKLDRTEISVNSYEQCVRAGRCPALTDPRRIATFQVSDVPAVFVTKDEAETYCRWRGARLPTEAEFELAARGPGRRLFPWGRMYHRGRTNAGRMGAHMTDARDGYELLAPIQSFPDGSTPQGVLNLSGNAAEWTSSLYGRHNEPESARSENLFVIKGGSFSAAPIHHRSAARRAASPNLRAPDVGFRCAQTIGVQSSSPRSPESR